MPDAPIAGAIDSVQRPAYRFSVAGVLAALLGVALLLAACGGGSGATATASTTASVGSPVPSPMSNSDRALAWSSCMRSHGVPNFPDPTQNGSGRTLIRIGPSTGIDPNSSQFKAAQQACQNLAPGGPQSGPGSADPQKVLDWAACVRAHGEPAFPDPTISGGVPHLNLAGIDPNSSQFKSAMDACQSLRPGSSLLIGG